MLTAVRMLEDRQFNVSEDQGRLRRKALSVVADFGPAIMEISPPDLWRMADMPCDGANDGNIFGQMWDKHRFIPTASMLKAMGGEEYPRLSELIDVLDWVWS